MIKGTLNGNRFTIDFTEDGVKIDARDDVKEVIKGLRGYVFNPRTYETYYTRLIKNEFDAYLLLSSQDDPLNVELSEYPEVETINDQEVVY